MTAALELAVELRHQRVRRRADRKRVRVSAVGRRDHVVVGESPANTDGNCLLADRDVEETGEVAGPESLLDLLLESPDQQHLPQEGEKLLAGQTLPLRDSSHEWSR